jgi:hypothetical protein
MDAPRSPLIGSSTALSRFAMRNLVAGRWSQSVVRVTIVILLDAFDAVLHGIAGRDFSAKPARAACPTP